MKEMDKKFKKGDVVEDISGTMQVVLEQYDNGTFKCVNPESEEINVFSNCCHKVVLEKVHIDNLESKISKREKELESLMKKVEDTLRWKKLPEQMPTIEKHYLVRVQYSFPKNYKAVIAELKGGVFYTEDDGIITDALAYTHLPNDESFDWQ